MKTLLALVLFAAAATATIPAQAGYNCTSYRVGNYTYTNCY